MNQKLELNELYIQEQCIRKVRYPIAVS